MSTGSVDDNEIVLRHVPGGTLWQGSPRRQRLTSNNFKLRSDLGEVGISVSRSPPTTPDDLISRVGNVAAGSRVAHCGVAAIRRLGLDVLPDPLPDDPGHAEIRSAAASLDDQEIRRQLAAVFQFC